MELWGVRPHDTAHFICKQREEKARGRREGDGRPAQVMASQSGISQATVLHYSVRLRVGSRGREEREREATFRQNGTRPSFPWSNEFNGFDPLLQRGWVETFLHFRPRAAAINTKEQSWKRQKRIAGRPISRCWTELTARASLEGRKKFHNKRPLFVAFDA